MLCTRCRLAAHPEPSAPNTATEAAASACAHALQQQQQQQARKGGTLDYLEASNFKRLSPAVTMPRSHPSAHLPPDSHTKQDYFG
jgi:hypothetical protein